MADCCPLWTTFARDEGLLGATAHWEVLLHPAQPTLGACVLAAKRHVEAFPALTPEEGADLVAACRLLEDRVRAAFGQDKTNYVALMLRDPHLHFHVFPRYAAPREVCGHVFHDRGWPGPVDFGQPKPAPEVVAAVLSRLRA
ncbi:MAG: HIT family protein [Planctomycetota bacterium]